MKIPKVDFVAKQLKLQRKFKLKVDTMVSERGRSLPAAVKKALGQDGDAAEELDGAVKAFASKLFKKHSANKNFRDTLGVLIFECAAYPESELAPKLIFKSSEKPCVVTGELVNTRFCAYYDTFRVHEQAVKAARESGGALPVWNEDAPPQAFLVPVRTDRAGILIQAVIAGSIRLAYNPLLGNMTTDEYASAAVVAMQDLAAL
jgi:hypothetical protein